MSVNAEVILAKVRTVNDRHRNFRESEESARRQYGISQELLAVLLQKGLPSREIESALRFDPFDLSNISLHLKLTSVQRMAMRSWAKTLELTSDSECTAVIELNPLKDETGSTQPRPQLHLELKDPEEFLGPEVSHLLDVVGRQMFFMLPEACRWNLAFLLEHGISECGGASKLLVNAAHREGIPARHCFGILVASPYSTGHFWAEIQIDGEWVAVDPLLIRLLHGTTRLSPEQWPLHRSPGAAFHRLLVIKDYDSQGAPVLDGYADVPYISNLVLVEGNLLTPLSLPTTLLTKS